MSSEIGNSGSAASEVERLEPWQLPAYLHRLVSAGTAEVTWNGESVTLEEARRRAATLSATATVVVDGVVIYVAEPDHSADDPPQMTPLQLGPRRR